MRHSETQPEERQPLRDEALCRSVFYGVLSLALYSPSEQSLEQLRSETARLALREAAQLLTQSARSAKSAESVDSGEAGSAVELVRRAEAWILAIESLELDVWLTSHGRLFEHTARGLVCPYETEFGQEGLFQQPRQLAKIMGFYRAFGLTTRNEERERPDHVSCELEFLDFLCRKEAFALESDEAGFLEETRQATRLFLRDHIGRFGRAFARLLQEQDPEGFFGKLGDLLFDFLGWECQRARVPAGPELLCMRSAEEDRVPMACGGPSDLVQLNVPE